MRTRVLVIGETGQLAREIARASLPNGMTVDFVGRAALDLTDADAARALVTSRRPDLVVIAAAYTAVDRAESEEALATAINGHAPRVIAETCARIDASLVHVSTDYVFDGMKSGAYVETDPVNPKTAYGRSKAMGEAGVSASGARAAIVRTSWVYSPFGANFVKTMLRLAKTSPEVSVVEDQIGRPTAACDLAHAVLILGAGLEQRDPEALGVFHYAGAGDASWADVADCVFEASLAHGGKRAKVNRISSRDYPTAATRPANSRLDTTRIEMFSAPVVPWRDGVARCVAEIAAVESGDAGE